MAKHVGTFRVFKQQDALIGLDNIQMHFVRHGYFPTYSCSVGVSVGLSLEEEHQT